jgi:catechol 2,3-dioxygenase-like lactoylglutathione lyase family enzyme
MRSPDCAAPYIQNKLMIIRVHHAQITIPRGAEDECRQFYCHLLGLPEVEKPAALQGRGGFWLQVGEAQVHVGTEDGVVRKATKAHLAYEVTDLLSWRTKLEEQGIEILEGIPIPGYTRFEFRDPFGNRVEFLQRT